MAINMKMHRYKKQRLFFLLMKPFTRELLERFYKYGFYILLIVVILQALMKGILS
jgi:hypothetical protein